ncbi:MAG: hypothetical protein GY929_03280 [Actinomycetia bacterium]|nr:hypothetical protein [Actinomycetes bacterium]
MTERNDIAVTLPADVNQVDETGCVWAFLSDADEPARIWPGAIIVAGDSVEPFLARVVDVIDGPGGESIVRPSGCARCSRSDDRRAPSRRPSPHIAGTSVGCFF